MIRIRIPLFLEHVTKVALLLLVLAVHGSFEQDAETYTIGPAFEMINDDLNYLRNEKLEAVQFASRERDTDDKTIMRNGILKLKRNAKATIVVCHGYMANKTDVGFLRLLFKDYNVFTFDFRAHGENNTNQTCSLGKYEANDVIGAVSYLKSRPETGRKPIIAYGFSMGAVSAIEAQAKHGSLFTAMILDCPFDSTDRVLKTAINTMRFSLLGFEFGVPGARVLENYIYNPRVQGMVKYMLKSIAKMNASSVHTLVEPVFAADSAEKISVPCYFITCNKDEKVPVESVVSIYAGVKGYKRLWITNGRRHFDSFFYNPEKYVYVVSDFIKRVVKGSLQKSHSAKIFEEPSVG